MATKHTLKATGAAARIAAVGSLEVGESVISVFEMELLSK